MQPLGRKPSRFPGKIDYHPKRPYFNWWEVELSADKKKAERQQAAIRLRQWNEGGYEKVGR